MDGKFKFSPRVHDRQTVKPKIETGLKQKDLVGIPWRVAFALQADGWWLRSDIIWAKPNPMPESVTDRPTKAHEYVFLLTKSAKYFFDQEAVREAHVEPWRSTGKPERGGLIGNVNGMKHTFDRREYNPAARNVRSVWDIPTQPYAEAHFATYPEELVRRCVLAGSSERGCCPVCGKPWERETEITLAATTRTSPPNKGRVGDFLGEKAAALTASGWVPNREKTVTTLGWRPGCDCPCSFDCAECRFEEHVPSPIPCTILDPFLGSGTTAFVARKHGRRSIGVELNESYANLAAKRMAQQSLFA